MQPKKRHSLVHLILLLAPIRTYFSTIFSVTFLSTKMISLGRLYRPACENYPQPKPLNLSYNRRLFPQRKKIQSTTSSSINDTFFRKIFPLSQFGTEIVDDEASETWNSKGFFLFTLLNLMEINHHITFQKIIYVKKIVTKTQILLIWRKQQAKIVIINK